MKIEQEKKQEMVDRIMNMSTEGKSAALPIPPGVSSEYADAVNGKEVDNAFYKYNDLAETIKSMPEEPKITTGLGFMDELLDGGYQAGELIIVSAPTKHGKCFGLGTKVLMHDGSVKRIENIVIGDKLMGDDSTPRKVLNLGSGKEMMYRVTLRNGDNFICNKSHILSLRKTGDINTSRYNGKVTSKRYSKGDIVNISLDEYLEKSKTFKHVHKSYKVGVDFNKAELSVDPYFIGIWLGDGNNSGPIITTADDNIVEYLNELAKTNNLKITKYEQKDNKSNKYSLVRPKKFKPVDSRHKSGYGNTISMKEKLKTLNLINNKHIPKEYKINSRKNRLKLLAGLIDSDGYKNNPSSLTFCNKNKRLCDDISFLCKSLGFSIRITSYIDKKYNNKYYKVFIGGDFSELPLLLKYKLPENVKTKKDVLNYSFKIEEIGIGKYYGVVLDKNNLFVLEDFTVVHNTSLCQNMSYTQGLRGVPSLWFTLEMSWQELTRKFMEMDWENTYRDKPADVPVYYQKDYRNLSLKRVREQIILAKEKLGVKMIFIDHLHFLLPLDKIGEGRSQTSFLVGSTVAELKRIAMELKIPIILIAHTKMLDVATVPDVNSIRDSSFIAQYSDMVVIMWRERKKTTAKDLEDVDGNDEDVFTGRVFVSLETNRRTGRTKRAVFGYMNGQFLPWLDYLFLKDGVDNVEGNIDRLIKVRDQINKNNKTNLF